MLLLYLSVPLMDKYVTEIVISSVGLLRCMSVSQCL